MAQIAGCRAILDAQHDQALLQVQRIAGKRGVVLRAAVVGLLIGRRQQRDHAGATFQALLHPRHEAGMAEILVLQPGREVRLADNRGDGNGERFVRASARDEKIA